MLVPPNSCDLWLSHNIFSQSGHYWGSGIWMQPGYPPSSMPVSIDSIYSLASICFFFPVLHESPGQRPSQICLDIHTPQGWNPPSLCCFSVLQVACEGSGLQEVVQTVLLPLLFDWWNLYQWLEAVKTGLAQEFFLFGVWFLLKVIQVRQVYLGFSCTTFFPIFSCSSLIRTGTSVDKACPFFGGPLPWWVTCFNYSLGKLLLTDCGWPQTDLTRGLHLSLY